MSQSRGQEFDPVLLQPASPAEVSAFVARAGELFTQAHVLKGDVVMGDDMPNLSAVTLDPERMRRTTTLSTWTSGEATYSSPLIDDYSAMPASFGAFFRLDDPQGLKGSHVSRGYHLVPSLADEQVSIYDATLAYRGEFTEAEIAQGQKALGSVDFDAVIREEDELNTLMGHRPDIISRLELREVGQVLVASLNPDTVRIEDQR